MSLELENMTPYKIYKQKNVKTLIKVGVPWYEGYVLGNDAFMFLEEEKATMEKDVNLLVLTKKGIEIIECFEDADLFYEIV